MPGGWRRWRRAIGRGRCARRRRDISIAAAPRGGAVVPGGGGRGWKSAEAHAGLAEVRERSGDADEARKEAQTSLTLGPSANAYLVLAQLDLAGGNLGTADPTPIMR